MYQIGVSLVFLNILRGDQKIIDAHPCKNPQVVSRNVIDHTLGCCSCIAETKRDYNPFKGPKLRVEGSYFDIFVMDSNLVEPCDKIYL